MGMCVCKYIYIYIYNIYLVTGKYKFAQEIIFFLFYFIFF